MKKSIPSKDQIAIVAFYGVAAALLAWRAFMGIDWTDESYYLAEAWRIVRGDVMFADIWTPHELAAMIYTPLVALYSLVADGNEGIILFMRLCYVAAQVGVAVLFYRCTRDAAGRPWALMASVPAIVGVAPMTFSYNSIALLGLFAGCALLMRTMGDNARKPACLVGSGIACGTAFVAFPTMLFALPLFSLWVLFDPGFARDGRARARDLVLYALGCAVCLVLVIVFLAVDGAIAHVAENWRNLIGGGRADPATHSLLRFCIEVTRVYGVPSFVVLALSCIAAATSVRISDSKAADALRCLALVGVVLLLAWQCARCLSQFSLAQLQPRLFLGMASVLVVLFLLNRCRWHASIWMLLMGVAASFGVYFVTYGNDATWYVFPFALSASGAILYWAHMRNGISRLLIRSSAAITAAFMLIVGLSLFCYVYRDAPLPQLNTRLGEGPGAGLYTTTERESEYREIIAVIDECIPANGTVLFAKLFPFGYLCTDALPAAPNTSYFALDDPYLLRYYEANPEKLPNAICVPSSAYGPRNGDVDLGPFFERYAAERGCSVIATDAATVYVFDQPDEP